MGCCKKYRILIPMYKQKFVWPYFKLVDSIFPVLVFAYEVQSPSKVCNTNSYINLEICMTILQTASLCRWQHHFWHTNMVTFESILYRFQRTSEVETEVILMGHPGLSCHVPVVRSIFILLILKYHLEIFARFTLLRMYYHLINFLIVTL
jgi:hypothetical protein